MRPLLAAAFAIAACSSREPMDAVTTTNAGPTSISLSISKETRERCGLDDPQPDVDPEEPQAANGQLRVLLRCLATGPLRDSKVGLVPRTARHGLVLEVKRLLLAHGIREQRVMMCTSGYPNDAHVDLEIRPLVVPQAGAQAER